MQTILITGAGLSGAVIARQLAEAGYSITVIDEKPEVGGHCQTYRDEQTGVMVHKYGPHIFHTLMDDVWEYVNRFATFKPYTNRVKAKTDKGVFSLPVNLLTLSQFFNKPFSPREAYDFIQSKADTSITEPANFEEQALSLMGEELYKAFFHGYTLKQWGRDPKELPASVLKRLPFRFNYDDNYFTHPHQGIPEEGYTQLIANILDHPQVTLMLNTPYEKGMEKDFHHMFYSGQLDRYFDFKLGRLEYRTLDFEKFYPGDKETLKGDYQGAAVVNYCSPQVPFTRITEHKHFAPWEEHEKTVCYREFSRKCEPEDTPYYPVLLSGRNDLLEAYKKEADKLDNITFVGRLGLYRYFDMDMTVAAAFKTVKDFLRKK